MVKFPVPEFIVLIFPVAPLNVTAFEVVAFVVEAFNVAKLPVVPNSVPIVPVTAFSKLVKKLVAARLVEVEFVIVEFVKIAVVPENKFPRKLSEKVLVWVALVIVEFVEIKFTKDPVVEPLASIPHSNKVVDALYNNLSVIPLHADRPAPEIFVAIRFEIVAVAIVLDEEIKLVIVAYVIVAFVIAELVMLVLANVEFPETVTEVKVPSPVGFAELPDPLN